MYAVLQQKQGSAFFARGWHNAFTPAWEVQVCGVFPLLWFTSVCVRALAPREKRHLRYRQGSCVRKSIKRLSSALETWGSRAQRRQRCGVIDRRADCSGWGWFSSLLYRCTSGNATPVWVLSETSFAVFAVKIGSGSGKARSYVSSFHGNDAYPFSV